MAAMNVVVGALAGWLLVLVSVLGPLLLVAHARRVVIDCQVYLVRYYLTPRAWRWPRVFLHHIRLPDPVRDRHDHPWDFWTLRLWGWYEEDVWQAWQGGMVCERTELWPRFRRAEHQHRIVAVAPRGCWTLVLAMPARRRWGFWTADGRFEDAQRVRGVELGKEDVIR